MCLNQSLGHSKNFVLVIIIIILYLLKGSKVTSYAGLGTCKEKSLLNEEIILKYEIDYSHIVLCKFSK